MTRKAFRDERIDRLNSWQEAMFHRILIACNDDGTLNADPAYIRLTLFPLKSDLRIAQVANALTTLDSVGLIALDKDAHGHPTKLTVSRDLILMTDKPSTSGRGGGCGGGDGYINNLNNQGENEGYEARKDELGDKPSWDTGDTESLDVTQEEADSYREAFEAVEEAARKSGMNCSQNALDYAMGLVKEYGLDDVLKAVRQSFDTPKWRYVGGILRIARERGEAVDAPKKPSKSKWFADRDIEAEKKAAEKWGEEFEFDSLDS